MSQAIQMQQFIMENKIKKWLFGTLLLVLLLPLIQFHIPFAESVRLGGFVSSAPDVTLSAQNWFDGSYQERKAAYYNEQAGFRPELIKITSQIGFSLFSKSSYNGTVIGKENCLFFNNYIDAYNGRDFVGPAASCEKMVKLKAVQDTLSHMGKTFLLVYAPNKADYFPEYIPDKLKCTNCGPTNYATYLYLSDSLGINKVNFNTWFIAMKSTSREPLFTKQGIHWTEYAALLAADSLIKYVEQTRNIQMRHPEWDSVEHTDDARGTDDDIAYDQNLLFPTSHDIFAYPHVHFTNDTTRKKPAAIFIGDSFIMNLVKSRVIENVFSNWEFWFYFRLLCNANNDEGLGSNPRIENYDWKTALDKTDCVIMLYTSIGLTKLGDGFIEQAYDYYYPEKK